MTTVFIIAGFNLEYTAASPEYQALVQGLTAKGYKVVPVDVNWRRLTFKQYFDKFEMIYKAEKTERNIVIGNSFGAVVAFMTASRLRPDRVVLCSTSPFFKEYANKVAYQHARKYFGPRRADELKSYSVSETAQAIGKQPISTTIMYGDKEHQTYPPIVRLAKQLAEEIPGAQLIEVPDCPHTMRDPAYIKAIVDLL